MYSGLTLNQYGVALPCRTYLYCLRLRRLVLIFVNPLYLNGCNTLIRQARSSERGYGFQTTFLPDSTTLFLTFRQFQVNAGNVLFAVTCCDGLTVALGNGFNGGQRIACLFQFVDGEVEVF